MTKASSTANAPREVHPEVLVGGAPVAPPASFADTHARPSSAVAADLPDGVAAAQSADSIRRRIRMLLARGGRLSRARATEIVGHDRDLVVPLLIEGLSQPFSETRGAAASLLCLLPDSRAIDALVQGVRHGEEDDLGVECLDEIAAHALALIGLPALPALERLARREVEINPACDALTLLARRHPEVKEQVAGFFVGMLRQGRGKHSRSASARALLDLDWRPAADEMALALNEGLLDPYVYDEEVQKAWLSGAKWTPRGDDELFRQPLERFGDDHLDVLVDYLLALDERQRESVARVPRRAFLEDVASLCLQPVRTAPRVGRNDPCPCGSGKKHKKCCLGNQDDDRRARLLRRASTVEWHGSGYAWTLSEQLERLPVEQLERMLDILASSIKELEALEAGDPSLDDYLLWAVAQRYELLGKHSRFQDLAVQLAASDAAHPALDYAIIERSAVLSDLREVHGGALRESVLDDFIRLGHLGSALCMAADLAESDTSRSLATYLRIWEVWPHVLWIPLAMSETLMWLAPDRLVDHLARAVQLAESGMSQAHPLLPDAVCPLDVLRRQWESTKERAACLAKYRSSARSQADDPLGPEERFILGDRPDQVKREAQRLAHELERTAECTSEAGLVEARQLVQVRHEIGSGVLARTCGSQVLSALTRWQDRQGPRWPVFVGERRSADGSRAQLVCVLPVKFHEVSADDLAHPRESSHPRVAGLAALLGELGTGWLEAAVEPVGGPWGEWVVLSITARAPADEDALAVCFGVLCEETTDGGESGAPWPTILDLPPLETLATDADLHALTEALARSVPPAPPTAREQSHVTDGTTGTAEVMVEEPDALSLRDLLKRVLTRLIRMNKIGAAHTEIGYFWRGVPTSQRGGLKDILEILVRQGMVRRKPTVTTPHISLEPTHLPAIFAFLDHDVPPCSAVDSYLAQAAAG